MNVWYVHPYAGSPSKGMSFRPYYLAKNLNLKGVKTKVISSSYHHLCDYSELTEGEHDIEGVPYYLIHTRKYKGNGIARLINMLHFSLSLFNSKFKKFAKLNKPDVIIASTAHPFHILAAKYYAKKYKAKLILEVRDIWPLSLQELVGLSKFHPLCVLINIFQRYAYRNCDFCVSLLENAEEFFISQGLKAKSFRCIPNGIELNDNMLTKKYMLEVAHIKEVTCNFDTVIGYTGAMGVPNNLDPLINAAKDLAQYSICFLLVGDGTEKKRLQAICKMKNIDNIFFCESIPKKQIASVISFCDAMFINSQHKDIYKFGISPNKIFDYMLLDKPIFNGIDSPNNPMEKSKSEIRFLGNSSIDLKDKVLNFHKNKSSYLVNSSSYIKEEFTYSHLADKYIEIF